ncbi:MAG: NIPSNAP family protein [Thermoanaerobaculia bacterium]
MIVIRNVFRIHPDRMKDAKALVPEIQAINKRLGLPAGRAMTDLTGPSYTLVLEMEQPSLAAWEQALGKVFADPDWQKSYGKFRPMVESGHREIYTVVG